MVELSEIITIVVAAFAALGEWIHWRRIHCRLPVGGFVICASQSNRKSITNKASPKAR